jgi:dethiobiotin synthetase
MSGIFITGTDTGVGKTLITGLLARAMAELGKSVITQKWVQTGVRNFADTDIATHLSLMKQNISRIEPFMSDIIPYCFKFPASPHLAAKREKQRINPRKIERAYLALCKISEVVLAEGAGGLMVPLTSKILFIDLAHKLQLPIVLVVHNKLGAINHALLSIETVRRRNLKLIGLIFNNAENQNVEILNDNVRTVASLSRENILGIVPYSQNQNRLYRAIKPMAENILNRIDHE